jgi:hypothetical protein
MLDVNSKLIPFYLVSLLLLVTNCNSSEFGAAGTNNKEGTNKVETSEKGEALGQAEGEEEYSEETEANQAVEVSGAFLTCQTDDDLPKANEEDIGFGCSVFESDGKRMDLSGAKFEFSMETNDGVKTDNKFDTSNPNYHAVSSVSRATVSKYQVLFYANEEETPALKSKIDSSSMKQKQESLEKAAEKETIFGSDSNFHIGDGDFSEKANGDCPAKLNGKDVQGKKIVLKVEVKSEYAYISGSLGEVCGVDRKNSYIILKTGYFDPQKTIPVKASSLDFGSFKVFKGTYTFEIRSGSYKNDLEDFVVGKIQFKAKGEVIFSEPTAAN